MLRSRFFPATCTCLKSVDELYKTVQEICIYAAERLGTGHSEKTYEMFLVNELYARRIPCLRQVKYYSSMDNNIYETGIVDLEVDQKLLLELKANVASITADHTTQAKRYLRSARQKYPTSTLLACVILFQKNGDVRFWRAKSVPDVVRMDVDVDHSDAISEPKAACALAGITESP